ncbi:MAG TPA: CPBP family intramembrane glutamic endopeptidase [Acidimicrobiales bacterium]|nr:CPBP family intramembrane glutamic endopeptidase [Acidimicrobiales bacterium]
MTHVAAAILASALAASLVFVQPWAGRRRYQRLLATLATEPDARIRHFRRGLIGEWAVSGVILVIGLLAGRTLRSIGLGRGPHPAAEVAIVVEVAIVLAVSAVVFRFGGSGIRSALRRQARGFEALLPSGRRERLVFAGLAVTAGICEELIFRGFAISYLRWLWPAAPRSAIIVITAAAFGLGHLYQGARGVILTGLVGAYLAWLVLSTGSLLPAMVIHALLDLRILALPDLRAPAPAPTAGVTPAPSTG